MAGEEDDIFTEGAAPEPQPDVQLEPPIPRTSEDEALSRAISETAKVGGRPTQYAPQVRPQPQQLPGPPQPQRQPEDEGDRSTAGILRALLDERQRRQGVEQQLHRYQSQEKPQPPNEEEFNRRLFERPQEVLNEFRQQILQEAVAPLQQQLAQLNIQHDMSLASLRHQDIWGDAWQQWYNQVGTGQDPVTYFRVMNAPSPGEELVAWFKEQRLRSEVGDDPAAYRERLRAELMAEMGMGPGPHIPSPPPPPVDRKPNGQFTPKQQVRLPTATSRLGNAGPSGNAGDEDGSEDAIFESARPRSRRNRDD